MGKSTVWWALALQPSLLPVAADVGAHLLDGGSPFHDNAPVRRLPSDGSSRWFTELHEYRYIEALLVIFFVAVTLIFELSWHRIRHTAEDSYFYGKFQHRQYEAMQFCAKHQRETHHGHHHESLKLQHVRHGKHLQLYKELVNRMGGEFMTLGFLALGIFTFNQSGGFKVMAKHFPPCEDHYDTSCFHFPTGAYEWLHMMEVVHVKLFLGMLLYFVFMTFLVNFAVKRITLWEKVKMRMDNVMTLVKNGNAAEVESELRYVDSDLDEHMLWRDNFIEHILGWQHRRPELFRDVAEKLRVNTQAQNAASRVRSCIENHFSLSSYLALNLEVGVGDSIQVHPPTWIALVATFAILALLHRLAYVQLRMVTPVIMLLFALLVFWVWRFSKDERRKMKQFVESHQRYGIDDTGETDEEPANAASKKRRVCRKNPAKSLEGNVMRAMQVFMFLESYALSCAIGDVDMWQDTPLENLLLVLAYALVFVIMVKVTPAVLPNFLAIVSFPPYISDKSLAAFFRVLFDKFELELEGEEPGDFEQSVAVDEVERENLRYATQRRSMRASMVRMSKVNSNEPEANADALAAVQELAALLGAREELDRRLRRRTSQNSNVQDTPAEARQPELPERQSHVSLRDKPRASLDPGASRAREASGSMSERLDPI